LLVFVSVENLYKDYTVFAIQIEYHDAVGSIQVYGVIRPLSAGMDASAKVIAAITSRSNL
jgi:hypothetical protein